MKPTAPKELNVFLKLLAVLALGGVFFLLFFSFFARVGSGIFLFSGIIPVSAGYFFGSWGGLVGGLIIFPLNFLLSRAVTGTSVEEFLWPNVAPNLGLVLIGVFVGRLRETQKKLLGAKIVQEKLRESEAKFYLFMDNAPIVGWVKDPETWKYLYVNKTFQTTFKIKMEEIVQKIPTVVVDHHLLRDDGWYKFLEPVRASAEKSGHRIITAAELAGEEARPLECQRRKLYEENKPNREFLKWAKLPKEKQSLTPPPL